ncbi:MAG: hypothetical protein FWB83_08445 [Treponema sp.]|nr:hypothetical protein [Treponema sp.]
MLIFTSCNRGADNVPAPAESSTAQQIPGGVVWSGAYPAAILQAGENPLWFQLTDEGPVHIESIEDAVFVSALVPWPYAPHISVSIEKPDGIVMAVNRDGFLKFAHDSSGRLSLYRFSGGVTWQDYTVGGFVYYNDKPAALLYLNDRFIDTNLPLARHRTWSFNMNSNNMFTLEIPALNAFPAEQGWNADTLRQGSDGFYYYRVSRRDGIEGAARMFRTSSLDSAGEEISIQVFYNSAPRSQEITHPSLPPLPEGFVYTGLYQSGGNIIASWEEQEEFNIGAAGFVVIKK